MRLPQGGMVARGKTFVVSILAASLYLSSCLDTRSVGSLTSDGGGGQGGAKVDAGPPPSPIRVLVWNNALTYGHASRALAIPYFKAREVTDGITFDTTYAHTGTNYKDQQDGDTIFDPSVFTDDGLDKYDVVMFLNTTGNTI